ncbi:hypothetical protein N8Z55_00240 [Pseudomonadales bacterium]|nr:hypothetical protein [Pseudomonadales bacterium]
MQRFVNIIRTDSKINLSGDYFFSRYNVKFKDIDTSGPEWLEMIGKLSILIYNLYSTMGIEYVVLGGGLIRDDMKSQLLNYLKEYNSSYLPVLN